MTQEVFNDLALDEHRAVDLLMRVKLRGHETGILVHIENQSTARSGFPERMFRYFCHLTLRHRLPVYPIVLFSYMAPKRAEPTRYEVTFPGKTVLAFDYEVVQLNRLSWRDFLRRDNPVATALMTKMKVARENRPRVRAECLRLLASQRLDPARTRLIGLFIDRYLKLSAAEAAQFEREFAQVTPKEQETTMEMMTSWELKGLKQGKQEGRHEGKEDILSLQIRKRFGVLPQEIADRLSRLSSKQLNALGAALFDLTDITELEQWLMRHS